MSHRPAARVPCVLCGTRIDSWNDDVAQPCGHTWNDTAIELLRTLATVPRVRLGQYCDTYRKDEHGRD